MRPVCSCGCSGTVHRHGYYERYADPEESLKERIQRYLCPISGLTFSVLPPHRLPYRAVRAERLQSEFDQRAGIQTPGLDPPPRAVEAGCLQRAWSALTSRSEIVALRGWVVIGAGVAALALPMALDAIGVVNWPSVAPFDRVDDGMLARIYLVSDRMMLACLLVFGAARLRVSSAAMFVGEENQGGRIMPAALGVCGVVLFLYQ